MPVQVDNSFIEQFESEAHVEYQRMGSKLRNTVRTKNGITGYKTTFQKVGKGEASTKARHGLVPVMNIDHTPVPCTLEDYYAGDWSDKLDELKQNIDERKITVQAGAYALGRKTDSLLVAGMGTTSNTIAHGGVGMTKAKATEAFETLGDADVPDDGQRYAVVGYQQWTDLMDIDEFANGDYVGNDQLPWPGVQAKRWLGTLWFPFSGLVKTGSTRECFWYHKTAVGHAIGAEVTSDITWHGDHAAHFINNMMSQGACLIDAAGCLKISCTET